MEDVSECCSAAEAERGRVMRRRTSSPVRPARLQVGMTVGVVAPASAPGDERLDKGIAVLEAAGYRVVTGDHLYDRHGYLAGTDAGRAADLTSMFARADVDAVFCARGGYGSVRVLRWVDWQSVRSSPKVFVGYSDVTTLHLALERHAGMVTFHGPMVTSLGGGLGPEAASCFWRAVTAAEPLGLLAVTGSEMACVVSGRARGRLVGGCLELLAAAVGTPEAPDFDGRLVLLEDVGIPPYRVDRALAQLGRGGLLERAAGFVVGKATDWQKHDDQVAAITPDMLWREYLAPLGKPTVVGFPFGHEPSPLTLPLGCLAELDADACALQVIEAAVA